MTQKGELFYLNSQKRNDKGLKYQVFGIEYTGSPISNIFSLEGTIASHKVIEKPQKEDILVIGGSGGILYTINTLTKSVIEKWNIG